MLKPEPVKKERDTRAILTGAAAVAVIAAVAIFLLYRFGVIGGDGTVKDAPSPAEQVLNSMPEEQRKAVRKQIEEMEKVPNPKPASGS